MTVAAVYGVGLACSVVALVGCALDVARDLRRPPGMTEQDVRAALYGDRGWGR